jgi:predicted dehydrogenase
MQARRVASKHQGSHVFSSIDELLAAEVVDVMHVCTPLATHRDLAHRSIEAGVHVLIEKPMTETAEETRQLLEAAAARSLLVCPVHQFPFQPGMRRLLRERDALGHLQYLEVTVCSAGGDNRPESEHESIVNDILPHLLSVAQAVLPGCLCSVVWHASRSSPGELLIQGEVDGFTMSFLVSLLARPPECALRLRTSNATYHVDFFHGYGFRQSGAASRLGKVLRPFGLGVKRLFAATGNLSMRVLRREPAYPGLRALVRSFYEAAADEGEAPIPPKDVLAVATARDTLIKLAAARVGKTNTR